MHSTETLLSHNIVHLEQGITMIQQLDDAGYTRTNPPLYGSSIGAHMRHVIEHYISFLGGVADQKVDYDARKRDVRMETDRAFAISVLEDLVAGLAQVSGRDQAVVVKLDSDSEADSEEPWSQSTVKRELQYLQAHTIHHYALIAMILRLQGQAPHEAFGVAPSTLKYRKRTLQPAS